MEFKEGGQLTEKSVIQKVLPRKRYCRSSYRPGFDLDKLREDILNVLWNRYVSKGCMDFYFKAQYLQDYGDFDVTKYTPALVSRIIHERLCPFPCRLHKKSKGHVFKTIFNGGKRNE